ncbi:hypothetical protein QQU25_000522 [Salmonella enterica]|nr:hypothetical protein [Salmonella enterica]
MKDDILESAWMQSFNDEEKKTISKSEAITALKKHHVYSSDSLEDAYLRSCDMWQPTEEDIETLRKHLEGVPDSEIQAAIDRVMAAGAALRTEDSTDESTVMARINSDAEKRRAELVNDGISIDDVEQRMSFYISERKRLAFGDGYR